MGSHRPLLSSCHHGLIQNWLTPHQGRLEEVLQPDAREDLSLPATQACWSNRSSGSGRCASGPSQDWLAGSQSAPEGGALLEAEVVQRRQLQRLGQHQLPGRGLRGAVLAVGVQHVDHRLGSHLLGGCQRAARYLQVGISSASAETQLAIYWQVREPHWMPPDASTCTLLGTGSQGSDEGKNSQGIRLPWHSWQERRSEGERGNLGSHVDSKHAKAGLQVSTPEHIAQLVHSGQRHCVHPARP